MPTLSVELFGVLRQRAGQSAIQVEASTVGEALAATEVACPELAGTLLAPDGSLRRDYRVAINGGVVSSDAGATLCDGDAVVVLSAHAGG